MKKILLPLFALTLLLLVSPVVYARGGDGLSGSGSSHDSGTSGSNSGSGSTSVGTSNTRGDDSSTKLDDKKNKLDHLLGGPSRGRDNLEDNFRRQEDRFASRGAERQQEHFASRAAELEGEIASKEAQVEKNRELKIATLKKKLQAFKDKKKAEIANRVDDNLNKINRHSTKEMAKHLTDMLKLLDRVQNHVASSSGQGKDVASASAAVAAANTAITNAQNTVMAQAGKDYTVSVSSESKIGADVKTVRDKLFADLKTTRQSVLAARQALVDAVRVVIVLGGGNND